MKFKNQLYPVIVSPTHIPELNMIDVEDRGIWFGASITLTVLDTTLHEQMMSLDKQETQIYAEIREMLRWFAGHQIRNVSVSHGVIYM